MVKFEAFEHPAFYKLFQLFKKKYYSLGRMRGKVSIRTFNEEEIEELAGFLAVPASFLKRKGEISLVQFEQQLKTSAFSMYTLQQLIEQVLGDELITKGQENALKQGSEAAFLDELRLLLRSHPEWLTQIERRSPDSRFIWQQQHELLAEIAVVARALTQCLEEQLERLPIFAQRTTGNPHAFDAQTLGGKLLVHAAFSMNGDTSYPKTTEERVDLLATIGIIQDDLWSFVTCQGLLAYEEETPHAVWDAAVRMNTTLNVPMRELMSLTKIKPAYGLDVWVVENSSVASTLMDAHPNAPIVCTHGQLRMASWRFLDLLEPQVNIHYSGDLDPEGLQIAAKIMQRYGGRAMLWRMDEQCYDIGKAELLTEARLAKLNGIKIAPVVVARMQEDKYAAYQEAWLKWLIADISDD
ncbi:MAG: TIGR02679 domain-containing protein [Solibacillus sp.]